MLLPQSYSERSDVLEPRYSVRPQYLARNVDLLKLAAYTAIYGEFIVPVVFHRSDGRQRLVIALIFTLRKPNRVTYARLRNV